jgi:hypothetical protein
VQLKIQRPKKDHPHQKMQQRVKAWPQKKMLLEGLETKKKLEKERHESTNSKESKRIISIINLAKHAPTFVSVF